MLWGNKDYATGNNKPLWANTTATWSNSTINGVTANSKGVYGIVAGVSAGEMSASRISQPAHAGWNSIKIGTGPITGVVIGSGGAGINAGGWIVVSDTYPLATGTGANISFTIANSQNTMQSYSSNAAWNVINSITVVAGGSGYANSTNVTFTLSEDAITQPSLTFVLGGRGNRTSVETLVAMGSITSDDSRDNVFFSGV